MDNYTRAAFHGGLAAFNIFMLFMYVTWDGKPSNNPASEHFATTFLALWIAANAISGLLAFRSEIEA
jgi:hypothetical protein